MIRFCFRLILASTLFFAAPADLFPHNNDSHKSSKKVRYLENLRAKLALRTKLKAPTSAQKKILARFDALEKNIQSLEKMISQKKVTLFDAWKQAFHLFQSILIDDSNPTALTQLPPFYDEISLEFVLILDCLSSGKECAVCSLHQDQCTTCMAHNNDDGSVSRKDYLKHLDTIVCAPCKDRLYTFRQAATTRSVYVYDYRRAFLEIKFFADIATDTGKIYYPPCKPEFNEKGIEDMSFIFLASKKGRKIFTYNGQEFYISRKNGPTRCSDNKTFYAGLSSLRWTIFGGSDSCHSNIYTFELLLSYILNDKNLTPKMITELKQFHFSMIHTYLNDEETASNSLSAKMLASLESCYWNAAIALSRQRELFNSHDEIWIISGKEKEPTLTACTCRSTDEDQIPSRFIFNGKSWRKI